MNSVSRPLPGLAARELLDYAHKEGFAAYLAEIGHDRMAAADRQAAAVAVSELPQSILSNEGPDYSDPYVAAAYMVHYHLDHCVLAYWAFRSLLAETGLPEWIYVLDIGAGTGAGRVGLALALMEREARPEVVFHSLDPGKAMCYCSRAFWRSFHKRCASAHNFYCKTYPDFPDSGLKAPAAELRIVTGFHPTLPWNDRFSGEFTAAMANIRWGIDLIQPQAELFTCHSGKDQVLEHAMGGNPDWPEVFSIPTGVGVEDRSSFYTDLAPRMGFDVFEGTSVQYWSRHRFSLPKGYLLWRRGSAAVSRNGRRP